MSSRHLLATACSALLFLAGPARAGEPPAPARPAAGLSFLDDPLQCDDLLVEGAALQRLTWQADRPAFPGDLPGSLAVVYDALQAPGRFGVRLPGAFTQDDPFTAAAVLVIESEGFSADPDGFFGISWGLWNDSEPGLDRTGDPADFAADTFEVLEFAWFPNVSPLFGGPWLSPALFGTATPASPLFPFLGGFSNFAYASTEAALPLDEPLLAVISHRPQDDAAVVSVHRIVGGARLLPVPGAVAVIDLGTLAERSYSFTALGLTLWEDGFSGAAASVHATVTYHQLVVWPGEVERLPALLRPPAPVRP